MGQNQSQGTKHYIQLFKCRLRQSGALVTESKIEELLEAVIKYKPCFPGEGTVDLECWDLMGENLKHAHKSGASLSVFSIWGLVRHVWNLVGAQRKAYAFSSPSD